MRAHDGRRSDAEKVGIVWLVMHDGFKDLRTIFSTIFKSHESPDRFLVVTWERRLAHKHLSK